MGKRTVYSAVCEISLTPGWEIRYFEVDGASFVRFTVTPEGQALEELFVYDHRPETVEAYLDGAIQSVEEEEESFARAVNLPAKVVVTERDGKEVFLNLYPCGARRPEALLAGTVINLPVPPKEVAWSWETPCVDRGKTKTFVVSITKSVVGTRTPEPVMRKG